MRRSFSSFFLWFVFSSLSGFCVAREEILTTSSPWRVHFTWGGMILGSQEEPNFRGNVETPAPRSEWAMPDFDDRNWVRSSGPWFSGNEDNGWGFGSPRELNLLTLRGKFYVENVSSAGDLLLNLKYRGGVRVFINGQEVTRKHLPEGALDRRSVADDYHREAYQRNGQTIPPRGEWHGDDFTEQLDTQRIRRSGDILIPRRLLKPGVNVIGLQLHPAAYRSDWSRYAGGRANWSTLGLINVNLQATGRRAVIPNVQPPEGISVWSANILERVGETIHFADPLERGTPAYIVAPRNGTGSTQLVVSTGNGGEVPEYSINISELISAAGDRLPESIWQIRYPGPGLQDSLKDRRSPSAAMLTANIPAAATPGTYEGTITVKISGKSDYRHPLRLDVAPWRAPPPRDFTSVIGILHSPDTIARHYGVPLWSDEHFKYMESSLQLLGALGNDILYIPLIRRTHLSNEETMIRWRNEGGRYEPDFSVLRRYLQSVHENVGRQSKVVLYLYEGGREPVDLEVTQVDARGRTSVLSAPQYGTEGSVAFWKPAFEGVRELVTELGWPVEGIHFGVFGDSWAQSQDIRDFFQTAAPDITWAMFTHARGHPSPDGDQLTVDGWKIGYRVLPYDVDLRRFPGEEFLRMGQDQPFFQLTSARGLVTTTSHPATFQIVLEKMMTTDRWRGLSRHALDFWPVDGNPIIGRYHRWHNLYRANARYFTYPGPDGAVSSIRYEALRTGIQETEASLLLDRAFHHHSDRLSRDLRERIQSIKNDRIAHFILGEGSDDSWDWFAGSGWPDRSLMLYQTAAEVAEAIGEVVQVDPGEEARMAALRAPREEELRTWTDLRGRTIKAAFRGFRDGQVRLQNSSGQLFTLALDQVSRDDRAFVLQESGFREWTSQDGQRLMARLLSREGNQIQIQRIDGQTFHVPLHRFSSEDQTWVETESGL